MMGLAKLMFGFELLHGTRICWPIFSFVFIMSITLTCLCLVIECGYNSVDIFSCYVAWFLKKYAI